MNKAQTTVQNTLVELIQATTGVLVSNKESGIRDISQLVQRGIQGKLAMGLAEEFKILKERGKVKEDYLGTDQFRQETSYIFDALKTDTPIDEKRLKAMKNIFFNSAKEVLSNRDSPLPVELMRTCNTLNMGEIVVLETAYRLSKEISHIRQVRYGGTDGGSWFRLIAGESGLGVEDMVATYEQSLREKGLMSPMTAGGNISVTTHYHLSGYGIKLCEFIMDYELEANMSTNI